MTSNRRVDLATSHEVIVLSLKVTRLMQAIERRDLEGIDAVIVEVKDSCERYEKAREGNSDHSHGEPG